MVGLNDNNVASPLGLNATVVHVLGSLAVGGAELRTLESAELLADLGITTHVVALKGTPGELAPRLEACGGRVVPMRLDAQFPMAFVRYLRQVRPVAVHSHVSTTSGVVLGLAAAAGVPRRVAHSRSTGDGRPSSAIRELSLNARRRLVSASATTVFGVTPDSLAYVLPNDHQTRKAVVLPNAVSVRRFEGLDFNALPPAGVNVIHVGKGTPAKNRPRVASIFAKLLDLEPDAHLTVVGPCSAEERESLTSAIAHRADGDRITFLGTVTDVLPLLLRHDVLLLPSVREGLPGVVLEAATLGLPVVASNLDGVRIIAEDFAGVEVVDLSADDTTWARALLRAVAKDPDTIQSRRQRAWRQLADSRFSEDAHVAKLLQAYGLAQ